MKKIHVPKFDFDSFPKLEEVSCKLDIAGVKVSVDTVNWSKFSYAPKVELSLVYGDKELYLKYYVEDKYFIARKSETNQNIYEDSCVEFFAAPSDDGYYNFEMNALGACLMGYGPSRNDRIRVNPDIVSKIRRMSSFGDNPQMEETTNVTWNLVVAIPFDVFYMHRITNLSGCQLKANFYKCGDKLSVPHYLSWNPIKTDKPDFHKPDYFGLLAFQ